MSAISRILNLPVNLGITRQSKSSDRDPQQGGGYSRQKQERQPTEEEAKKAFAILLELESIKKNGLQVELQTDDSVQGTPVYVLLVKDQSGARLRGLRGSDILRLLEQGPGDTNKDKPESGRILDRRV